MKKRARKCDCGKSFKAMPDGVWNNVKRMHLQGPKHKERMAKRS